ncbi:MAG: hypothetical protein OEY23_22620 [Acidimicrobiia bacterium]|nr:hypothetical protein [Acidimicrobiia bacterium]
MESVTDPTDVHPPVAVARSLVQGEGSPRQLIDTLALLARARSVRARPSGDASPTPPRSLA